jgi:hypothetical protein
MSLGVQLPLHNEQISITRNMIMNKTICSAAFAVAFMAGSGVALAQAVVIEPQQETVIKEYVTKHKVTSVEVPNVKVAVGTALPETVELHTIDAPNVTYRYVNINGTTALVDPGTRKVVRVID